MSDYKKNLNEKKINLDSKKGIYARVLDSNTVMVNF